MRILVTGGAGFIASHIADKLIQDNHSVIVIDNLSTGKKENLNPKAKFYFEDLSNHNKIQEIFEKEKPEVIYHLAAQIDVRKSVSNPVSDAEINIINTLNLLELAVNNKVKHFIFSSTGGAIYGDTENIPTNEEEREMPVSPYGCAKLAIEKYLNFYNKVHGLKYNCLRYSNVYGPRQNSKGEAGVISIFFEKMLHNENPIIFGGEQTRDFVFVEDVAKANILALEQKDSGIFNVGTGKEISINELFSKMNSFFNGKFSPEHQEMKKGEQKRSCLSFEKINKTMNWVPETSLESGLKKTYEWFLQK